MGLPNFLNGIKFNGQTTFYTIIHGQVVKGEANDPFAKPYQAFFGWHITSDYMKWSWSPYGPGSKPYYFWVDKCYSSKQSAIKAQKKIKCRCGQKGITRYIKGYIDDPPLAVGVWCDECWGPLLERKGATDRTPYKNSAKNKGK